MGNILENFVPKRKSRRFAPYCPFNDIGEIASGNFAKNKPKVIKDVPTKRRPREIDDNKETGDNYGDEIDIPIENKVKSDGLSVTNQNVAAIYI